MPPKAEPAKTRPSTRSKTQTETQSDSHVEKSQSGGGDEGVWENFKEIWVDCEVCHIWTLIRVKEEWEAGGKSFLCGTCSFARADKLKKENRLLEARVKELEGKGLGHTPEVLKTVKVFNSEGYKSFSNVVSAWDQKGMNAKFEKLEGLQSELEDMRKKVREQVITQSREEYRKKRMIVFGLEEVNDCSDRVQVEDIMGELGVDAGLVKVVDVERMRKKGGETGEDNKVRPVIVEFRSSHDKWLVLENKQQLKNMVKYKRVFLEADRTKEERDTLKSKRQLQRVPGSQPSGQSGSTENTSEGEEAVQT